MKYNVKFRRALPSCRVSRVIVIPALRLSGRTSAGSDSEVLINCRVSSVRRGVFTLIERTSLICSQAPLTNISLIKGGICSCVGVLDSKPNMAPERVTARGARPMCPSETKAQLSVRYKSRTAICTAVTDENEYHDFQDSPRTILWRIVYQREFLPKGVCIVLNHRQRGRRKHGKALSLNNARVFAMWRPSIAPPSCPGKSCHGFSSGTSRTRRQDGVTGPQNVGIPFANRRLVNNLLAGPCSRQGTFRITQWALGHNVRTRSLAQPVRERKEYICKGGKSHCVVEPMAGRVGKKKKVFVVTWAFPRYFKSAASTPTPYSIAQEADELITALQWPRNCPLHTKGNEPSCRLKFRYSASTDDLVTKQEVTGYLHSTASEFLEYWSLFPHVAATSLDTSPIARATPLNLPGFRGTGDSALFYSINRRCRSTAPKLKREATLVSRAGNRLATVLVHREPVLCLKREATLVSRAGNRLATVLVHREPVLCLNHMQLIFTNATIRNDRRIIAIPDPSLQGATVSKRLACSPPTKAIRFQSPAPGHSGYSQAGIVPDDAVGRRDFSGISRFPHPFIPALLHTHLHHPHRLSRLIKQTLLQTFPADKMIGASCLKHANKLKVGGALNDVCFKVVLKRKEKRRYACLDIRAQTRTKVAYLKPFKRLRCGDTSAIRSTMQRASSAPLPRRARFSTDGLLRRVACTYRLFTVNGPVKNENTFSCRQQPTATDELLLGACSIEVYPYTEGWHRKPDGLPRNITGYDVLRLQFNLSWKRGMIYSELVRGGGTSWKQNVSRASEKCEVTVNGLYRDLVKNEGGGHLKDSMKWSGEILAALNNEVLRADEGDCGMEQRRNERAGKTGDPRENQQPTASCGTIPTCGATRTGTEPGSPRWEASRLTAQPPWLQLTECLVVGSIEGFSLVQVNTDPNSTADGGYVEDARPVFLFRKSLCKICHSCRYTGLYGTRHGIFRLAQPDFITGLVIGPVLFSATGSVPALVPGRSHCRFRAQGAPRGYYLKRVEETEKEASILILHPTKYGCRYREISALEEVVKLWHRHRRGILPHSRPCFIYEALSSIRGVAALFTRLSQNTPLDPSLASTIARNISNTTTQRPAPRASHCQSENGHAHIDGKMATKFRFCNLSIFCGTTQRSSNVYNEVRVTCSYSLPHLSLVQIPPVRNVLEFSERPSAQQSSLVGFHAFSPTHTTNTSPAVVSRSPVIVRPPRRCRAVRHVDTSKSTSTCNIRSCVDIIFKILNICSTRRCRSRRVDAEVDMSSPKSTLTFPGRHVEGDIKLVETDITNWKFRLFLALVLKYDFINIFEDSKSILTVSFTGQRMAYTPKRDTDITLPPIDDYYWNIKLSYHYVPYPMEHAAFDTSCGPIVAFRCDSRQTNAQLTPAYLCKGLWSLTCRSLDSLIFQRCVVTATSGNPCLPNVDMPSSSVVIYTGRQNLRLSKNGFCFGHQKVLISDKPCAESRPTQPRMQ
ncbi:hypothetical protein PR048_029342 [Dryococelus australis]|uniref:Uncharacterized protein n=1 Tax=Dryococelus australis TaxID=614101 RepID=A0ABQ9GD65_9NEOP|nr:hypothetical protein PR048_029342 [Dryococelus australis]